MLIYIYMQEMISVFMDMSVRFERKLVSLSGFEATCIILSQEKENKRVRKTSLPLREFITEVRGGV